MFNSIDIFSAMTTTRVWRKKISIKKKIAFKKIILRKRGRRNEWFNKRNIYFSVWRLLAFYQLYNFILFSRLTSRQNIFDKPSFPMDAAIVWCFYSNDVLFSCVFCIPVTFKGRSIDSIHILHNNVQPPVQPK